MLLCSRGVTTSAACELTARSLLRQVHADSFGGTSAGGAEESAGEEKWEGGVMAPSGVIYAMPQQSQRVLRIDPGPAAAS